MASGAMNLRHWGYRQWLRVNCVLLLVCSWTTVDDDAMFKMKALLVELQVLQCLCCMGWLLASSAGWIADTAQLANGVVRLV